ncbi:unnamed protein product [Trifolium pratense]|uniref:Uncharacterized protein n=1 Tax=Trifolium pratense TaxID=57577 RepID=A0ACB0JWW7_TRIPR|nr:unnamed protein product [Trifolium pratense]
MSKTLVILFFMIFNIIMHSAYGNTRTIDTGDSRTSKQQNEPKPMYMVMEPSKPGTQRIYPGLHVAQAKGIIYKGPSNLNPHNVRGRSNCNSIKPSSLFMATLRIRNIIFILLLVPCFF